jgi:hypothetical protein
VLQRAVGVEELRPGHADLGVSLKGGEQGGRRARPHLRVRIQQPDIPGKGRGRILNLAPGQVVAGGEAQVLIARDEADAGKLAGHHRWRAIGGIVVHHIDLGVQVGVLDVSQEGAQTGGQ